MNLRHTAKKVVIRIEALSGLAFGALDLDLFQLRPDRAHYAGTYSILQLENILKATIEPVGPKVCAACSVDELPGDAYPVRSFSYATFQHIAHAKLATDLPHVHDSTFISKA
jgi:hypothetical protein